MHSPLERCLWARCIPSNYRVISLYVDKPPATAMAARQAIIPKNQAYP